MSWEAICHSIMGDKNKGWQRDLQCCYQLCPSNQPFVGAYKPKFKFVQKISPMVYQYRCKNCGCLVNVSVATDEQGRENWRINPALVGQRPSYDWGKHANIH